MSNETKITIIGFVTMFIIGVSDLIIIGIITPMSKEFQVSQALIGQLVTIYAVAFALLSPILTKWTSKFPDKVTLLASLLLFIVINFTIILASSFIILCILRVILAACASLVTIKLMAIGAKVCPPDVKSKVVANIYVGFSASNILGVPIGTLLAARFEWTIPFYGIGILSIFCFVLICLEINTSYNIEIKNSQGEYVVKSKKGVYGMLFFLFLMMISNSLLFTYIEPIIRNGGHSLNIVSIALFLSGVAGVIGSKLGNILSEKYGAIMSGTIIIAIYTLSLVGLLLLIKNVLVVLSCIMLWNLFHWGTNPTVQYALLQFIEGDPSQIFSYNISILNLGIGVGSLIGGILYAKDSTFTLSLVIGIILSLLSFVILQSLRRVVLKYST